MALEKTLGNTNLVWPCYSAYLELFQQYEHHSRPWPVTTTEQVLIDLWEKAELAAAQAAFGVYRYLGDTDFEILVKLRDQRHRKKLIVIKASVMTDI